VRIVFSNPLLQYARRGFTMAVLTAAGYRHITVVHEQLGGSRLFGNAPLRIPCADTIVAYVAAEESDLILRQLPDAFEVADRPREPTTIFVDGRTARQPQKWRQEQLEQQRRRERGHALEHSTAAGAAQHLPPTADAVGMETAATTAATAVATTTVAAAAAAAQH
jgi:hypothetical protein